MAQIKDQAERTSPASTDQVAVDDAANVTYRVSLANLGKALTDITATSLTTTSSIRAANSNIRSSAATFDTLTDDSATSFTPPAAYGIMILAATNANLYALVHYNTSSAACTGHILGSSVVVGTGALTTGTGNGTDTKFNINAHSDGKIYLKNRTGITINFNYLVI